ncbi:MAG: hypothetical protein IPG97_12175 [Microthrixaceae bacterium]|nr:hypothetical protein [Microthrixaceae bacterium]
MVDPGDVDAWARTVADVLDDPALQHRLSTAAKARAATLTWDRTADAGRRIPSGRCHGRRMVGGEPSGRNAPTSLQDLAPTGEVMTQIVEQLAQRGHRISVVTSCPGTSNTPLSPAGKVSWSVTRTPVGRITLSTVPHRQAQHPRPAPSAAGFAGLGMAWPAIVSPARPDRSWPCPRR